jgi:hypothetical protein
VAGLPWILSFAGVLEITSALSRQLSTANSCRMFSLIERAPKDYCADGEPGGKGGGTGLCLARR